MTAYRMNAPDVVAETIDGEAVVINLDRGTYYSIRGSGAALWDALIAGVPTRKLVAEIARIAPEADAAKDVEAFVNRLVGEELVVPAEGGGPVNGAVSIELPAAYAPPSFDTYTDMEALLLLDPIHDVDEAGWPQPA